MALRAPKPTSILTTLSQTRLMMLLGALAMSQMGAVPGRESTTRKVRFARCCGPSALSTTAYRAAAC